MKAGRWMVWGMVLGFIVALSVAGCSSSGGSVNGSSAGDSGSTIGGTTEDGAETASDEPTSYAAYATKMARVAGALIPAINASDAQASLSKVKSVSYGESDDWDVFLEDTNITTLTDIFGSADEEPRVVTKVRVLVEQFESDVQAIVERDPEINCSGAAVLNEGDDLDVAFYGVISNGTAGDRRFDCIYEREQEYRSTVSKTLYGIDNAGVLRFAMMEQNEGENDNDPSTQGNTARALHSLMAAFLESEVDGVAMGHLDLQYVHAVIYSGADDVVGTEDDVIFKARSRITGQAEAVEDGEGQPVGEFTVTKYDKGFGGTMEGEWNIITKSMGRGIYADGSHLLFNIDPNASSLEGLGGVYCIRQVEDAMPRHADSENCEAYELAHAWGDDEFPIPLSPALEEDFESREFFEGNDVDMIADDGGNFTIPDYESLAVSEPVDEEPADESEGDAGPEGEGEAMEE